MHHLASVSRVEGGRGGCALASSAPLPVPAHQNGRADFQHPAFPASILDHANWEMLVQCNCKSTGMIA
jgi:hypothetical protein